MTLSPAAVADERVARRAAGPPAEVLCLHARAAARQRDGPALVRLAPAPASGQIEQASSASGRALDAWQLPLQPVDDAGSQAPPEKHLMRGSCSCCHSMLQNTGTKRLQSST